jgi:hypothetical protein
MKKISNFIIPILILFCISSLGINSKAQTTKELNQFLPMHLLDSRGTFHKTIGGLGFNVRADIIFPIQWLEACDNEASHGDLKLEIIWYDLSDETAKYTIDIMKQLGGIEQEKKSFLGTGEYEKLAGGDLKIVSSSDACINEITGPTGKLAYQTSAFYYCFTGTTFIKLSLSSAIKPETAKTIISKIGEDIKKFNFSVYKNRISDKE